jgi:hypothetical protein
MKKLEPTYETIRDSQYLGIVFIRPKDRNGSDVDDCLEDDERPKTIRDVGRCVSEVDGNTRKKRI